MRSDIEPKCKVSEACRAVESIISHVRSFKFWNSRVLSRCRIGLPRELCASSKTAKFVSAVWPKRPQARIFLSQVITSDYCGVATFTVDCWSKHLRTTWELRFQGCLLVSINSKPQSAFVGIHVHYQSSHCCFTSQSCHETCAETWRKSVGKQVYVR